MIRDDDRPPTRPAEAGRVLLWQVGSDPAGAASPPYVARFESVGVALPENRLGTTDLVSRLHWGARVDLEGLTGIRERRICGEGEDGFTLAVAAARDCLARSRYAAADIDLVVSCAIGHYKGGYGLRAEPPLSLSIKNAIGARRALHFDLTNACAGMLTAVFLAHEFIRSGTVRRAMVVSGEFVSHIGMNATRSVRTMLSPQLASLTVGDAGAAVIVERAPRGVPGIRFAGFTTFAQHSRLCIGRPSPRAPGGVMFTKAREIHQTSIAYSPFVYEEVLAAAGMSYDEIDFVIPHQTSERAIRKCRERLAQAMGCDAGEWVCTVADYGNTASTTHFVALHRCLRDRRIKPGDRVMLAAYASGLVVGVVVFVMDDLAEHYADAH